MIIVFGIEPETREKDAGLDCGEAKKDRIGEWGAVDEMKTRKW